MREEFMITRQGKQYVLFAGLLDESHQRFDKWWEMNTELTQAPSTENGMVAIVKATFIGEPKDSTEQDRKVVKASGIGDASPENVGRAIVPHIIRMAETRAKARALRDAVNVGATSLEELSEDEHDASQSQRGQPQRSAQRGAAKNAEAPPQGKKGELLKEIRDNFRLIYGDQWQDAERKMVRESASQKPLMQLTITELEKVLKWTEDQANRLAEEAARAQAQETEEEFSDQEIPF